VTGHTHFHATRRVRNVEHEHAKAARSYDNNDGNDDDDDDQVKKDSIPIYNMGMGVTIARPPNQQQEQRDEKASNDNTNPA
jgi:hypothetical protein